MTKQKRDVYEEDFEDEEPDFSDPEDFVDKISDQGLFSPNHAFSPWLMLLFDFFATRVFDSSQVF